MKKHAKIRFPFLLVACFFALNSYSQDDSAKVLPPVKIIDFWPVPYQIARLDQASPSFYLDKYMLTALGVKDLGEALKFIPGTQVKDYGGVGGVKTVAFRSLGAAHTGVNIDNMPMLNLQVGSINLSAFESFGMKSVSFSTGQPSGIFSSATSYIPANQINIYSELYSRDTSFNFSLFQRASTVNAFESGLKVSTKLGERIEAGAQLFARYGTGQYNFKYNLAGSDEVLTRTNSDIMNYKGRFNLSTRWDMGRLNIFYYHNRNEQQLPGAVILYNPSNDQTITNEDNRIDALLTHVFNDWTIGVNAYLHNNYTAYVDPSYLNAQGFIASNYFQSTMGTGAIVNRLLDGNWDRIFFGTDALYSALNSNEFSNSPARLQFNSVAGGSFDLRRTDWKWKIEGNLSHQLIFDQARSGDSLTNTSYSKFNPFVAVAFSPFSSLNMNFRTFYKRVFRMPTFNDLYYNFIGNTNLQPEDAHIFNVGFNWSHSKLSYLREKNGVMLEIGVDGYLNYVQNKIVAIPTKDLFNWSMQNIGNTRAMGVDFITTYMHQFTTNWRQNISVSVSYNNSMDISNENSPSYGHQIPYTPLLSGSFSYSISYKGYALESSAVYSGVRYSLNENIPMNRLDPFVDMSIGLAKNWEIKKVNELGLSIKAMNILNKNYEVIRSFPMPGRHYQFALTYSFK